VTDLETELRELCAWYEWGHRPNVEVAGVLQDAADAMRVRALSPAAAKVLIAAWQPFAGLEAQTGDSPELMTVANTEHEVLRGILAHMRRMVTRETHPAKRVHLAKLLEKQIQILEGGRCE